MRFGLQIPGMLVSVGQDWQIERLLQERVPFKSKLRNEARRWCQKGKSRWTVFFFLMLMAIFAIFQKTMAISAISANSVAIFGVFPKLKGQKSTFVRVFLTVFNPDHYYPKCRKHRPYLPVHMTMGHLTPFLMTLPVTPDPNQSLKMPLTYIPSPRSDGKRL